MTKHKMLKAIIGVVAFVVALTLIYIGINAIDSREMTQIEDDDTDSDEQAEIVIDDYIYKVSHPVKSYLFMGTDGSGNEDVTGDEYQGSMADFIMLLVIDEKEKKFGFLEINRDTMTEVALMDQSGNTNVTMEMQICIAHAYGGSKRQSCKNTVNAVSQLLHNVPIDGYYALPMEQIEHMNRALGGISVLIEEDMTDIDPAFVSGSTVQLTDEQAVKFLRGRMGVQDGENTSRMNRQRIYLNAAFETIKEKSQNDTKYLANAFKEFEDIATSDMDMNPIIKLGQNIAEYESLGILRIDGEKGIEFSIGDEKDHSAFYADDQSIVTAIQKLYPLEKTNEVVETDEEFDEEDYGYDEESDEEDYGYEEESDEEDYGYDEESDEEYYEEDETDE